MGVSGVATRVFCFADLRAAALPPPRLTLVSTDVGGCWPTGSDRFGPTACCCLARICSTRFFGFACHVPLRIRATPRRAMIRAAL